MDPHGTESKSWQWNQHDRDGPNLSTVIEPKRLLGYEPFGGNNANNLFTTISLLLEKRNFQRKNKRLKGYNGNKANGIIPVLPIKLKGYSFFRFFLMFCYAFAFDSVCTYNFNSWTFIPINYLPANKYQEKRHNGNYCSCRVVTNQLTRSSYFCQPIFAFLSFYFKPFFFSYRIVYWLLCSSSYRS